MKIQQISNVYTCQSINQSMSFSDINKIPSLIQQQNYRLSNKSLSPKLLKVYFGVAEKNNPKTELKKIIKEKIKANGILTPDMIDKNMCRLLFNVAMKNPQKASAKYSNFHVGAALITEKGNIIDGTNVENVTYNSNLHGETVAIGTMITKEGPNARIVAIATCAKELNPCAPCGSCRQNIAEFSRTWDVKIITAKNEKPANKDLIIKTLGYYLPDGFSPAILKGEDNIK